ncbi:MAG: type II secretion system F family protein [bacterium]|nr:type II secretion system F family protein [bacterium]
MNKSILKPLFVRLPLKEKILFVNHLSIAVRSGMTLTQGLNMIKIQTQSRSFKKVLDIIIADVESGTFLSASLEKFKRTFGNLFINVVRVGEASGTLAENLKYLSDEMKKSYEIRKKIRGAMLYPLIVFTVAILISVGLVVFVVPKFVAIFAQQKAALPLPTTILINISNFLRDDWMYAIGIMLGIIVLFRILLRVQFTHYYIHRTLLMLPILGTIMIKFNMSSITRILALLLNSGVKIVEAITITSDTNDNLVYKRALEVSADYSKRGEYLSKYFSTRSDLFPLIVTNMIAIGENTGNLVENLRYLAGFYEEEVDDFSKNLSSIIEPFMLVILGGIVAFIALSIILPIYQLTRTF